MRILILGLNYAPEPTGIGKYTGEMARYLARAGHDVRVVTSPPYYPWWKVQAPYRWWGYSREKMEGVEVFRTPLWVPGKLNARSRILHLLSFAISSFPVLVLNSFWQPDIVFTTAPSLFNAPFAWLTGRLSGAGTWLHVQDFELDAAVHLGAVTNRSLPVRMMRSFERWILRRFDCVSTISNRMVARLLEKGVEPGRVKLVPNWVDSKGIYPLGSDDPVVSEMKKALGLPEEKMIALYAGNMGKKQGLELILEAARILQARDDLVFMLCGEGAVRRELERLAEGLANVMFGPLQPVEKLNALLNTADIHLLPQRADAADLVMPSKLSGMLASGRPVIATAQPGTELAEVVSEVGVVVPPGDCSALAGAVLDLCSDEGQSRQMGMKGRSWVEEHWAKERVLEYLNQEINILIESEV